MTRTTWLVGMLLACLLLYTPQAVQRTASAQERPAATQRKRGETPPNRAGQERDQSPERERATDVERPKRERAQRGNQPDGRDDDVLGRPPFEPSAEDRRALGPGEEQELMDFAREHVPNVHRLLEDARRDNPRVFRKRLEDDAAPRLRHLKRVFAENPRLGRIVVAHSDNLQKIRRGMRALGEDPQPPERRRIMQKMRELLAGNVRLELQARQEQIQQRVEQRDDEIQERFARLQSASADLSAEPEPVRAAVESLHAATSDDQRETRLEALHGVVLDQFDAEIAALRTQLDEARNRGRETVERRMQRLIQSTERRQPDRP